MTEREEKWPEGPWYSVVDDFDGTIELTCDARSRMVPLAKIDMGFTDAFEETQKAALKLMESAPALYEALEGLVVAAKMLHANCWLCVKDHHQTIADEQYTPHWLDDAMKDINNARAALSQARGETGEEG